MGKEIHIYAAAIEKAAKIFIKNNPLMTDGQNPDILLKMWKQGARSQEAADYHAEKNRVITEEFYVSFESAPGILWGGKTNEALSKICNGEPIWLEPSSGTERNMATGKDEWQYNGQPLELIPASRIFSYKPIIK